MNKTQVEVIKNSNDSHFGPVIRVDHFTGGYPFVAIKQGDYEIGAIRVTTKQFRITVILEEIRDEGLPEEEKNGE